MALYRYFSKPSNDLSDLRKMPSSSNCVTYVAFEVVGRGQAVCTLDSARQACASVEVCHTKFKRTKIYFVAQTTNYRKATLVCA